MAISARNGEFLVKLSRGSIQYYLDNLAPLRPPKIIPEELKKQQGVFCTLLTYPRMELRGCIGTIFPEKNLVETLIEVSCSSTQDPRFIPLHPTEAEMVIVEVTVLSELEEITVSEPREYLNHIELGKDGLFLKKGYNSAVFLPQVPIEQKWNAKTYLCELCRKAGLDRDAWILGPVQLYKFQAQIFAESEPSGSVFEKVLNVEGKDAD
jgi:uncharacterized protein (TIGR00296 family)